MVNPLAFLLFLFGWAMDLGVKYKDFEPNVILFSDAYCFILNSTLPIGKGCVVVNPFALYSSRTIRIFCFAFIFKLYSIDIGCKYMRKC